MGGAIKRSQLGLRKKGMMGIQLLRMNYPSYLDHIRRSWIAWAPLQEKKEKKKAEDVKKYEREGAINRWLCM